ncbi:HepT-like ribonuclease domain-containing protein [Synechococcus sp. 1G10]|uniref:HepT-like ribonuclease domain-containing protein n=1 Tax=Synechococcus sp. 1G10 TaxID=2025605 RepID=UPI000B98479F
MARDISAYLCDIIDACNSISSILVDISIETYVATREKRSAVEREFILIGEAASMLAKFWPDRFKRLSDGRKAIGFRNILTHNYASVDYETVYETALNDVPKLRSECFELLRESEGVVKDGPEERPETD